MHEYEQRHVPEDSTPLHHHCENIKSQSK